MTPEEAIKRINRFTFPGEWDLDRDDVMALKLGIEALKRIQDGRSKGYDFFAHLLPGETAE